MFKSVSEIIFASYPETSMSCVSDDCPTSLKAYLNSTPFALYSSLPPSVVTLAPLPNHAEKARNITRKLTLFQ